MSDIDTSEGTILEVLNSKVDIPNGVSQSDMDYVIESKFFTVADPTWYRVYKSGWVEQGGQTKTTVAAGVTDIAFPIPMASTNYTINVTDYATSTASITIGYYNKQTTSIGIVCNTSGRAFCWEVKGLKA